MSKTLQPVRGTHDLLPDAYAAHAAVIRVAEETARLYGYARMDTPIFEFSELFHRSLGDTSDIVTKETYTFERSGESLTLRPEFTAALVRAFISNGLQQNTPVKWFYAGPAFRYERPQKGRQRQFHQIGCELLGAEGAASDIEMIALAAQTLAVLGLKEIKLELNSLGDAASRAAYREKLVAYFSQHADSLSDDSKTRLYKNPLRILDSKDAGDRSLFANAPKLHDSFNAESAAYFAAVCAGLDGLGIAYTVSDKLVRGLDYYSHTVFEFTTDQLGAQGTVLAGGRYNELVEELGGKPTPCIGFAAGVERLAALREVVAVPAPAIAVVAMEDAAEAAALQVAQELRAAGIATEYFFSGKPGKKLQRADKMGCAHAVMLGGQELADGTVTLKALQSGAQQTMPRGELIAALEKEL